MDLISVAILGPVEGEPGVYTFTTTYTPTDATPPTAYEWDDGGVLPTSTRTLDVGVHTLVVTATNCTDALVVDTHTITVSPPCTEVIGVNLTQVTTGTIYTDTLVTFRADIMPNDADVPYTYTVDFGMGAGPPALSSDDPLTLTHTYTAVGTYDVTIAVWNCDMMVPVTGTLQVTVSPQPCTEVIGVDLTQVTTGTIYTDTLVTFRADIAPDDADVPYTYTIDFGLGASAPALSSDDPLTLTHTYILTGTYDVAIAVWNCDMTIPVTDMLQVTVVEREEILNYLYLPIVLKNF
jgi:hypothetical protein